MPDAILQPCRITWTEKIEDEEFGHHWMGEPSDDDDAYETEILRAHSDGFRVDLGSFTITGDAGGFTESKRFAESAFRSLIELSNHISFAPLDVDVSLLSGRERDVAFALGRGVGLLDIAQNLRISKHTARNHLKRIFRKLDVHSQVELVAKMGAARG